MEFNLSIKKPYGFCLTNPQAIEDFHGSLLRPISIRALIRSDMERCDAFLMFHIVRHLSHKSIIYQNNHTFPKNDTIGQEDVKVP